MKNTSKSFTTKSFLIRAASETAVHSGKISADEIVNFFISVGVSKSIATKLRLKKNYNSRDPENVLTKMFFGDDLDGDQLVQELRKGLGTPSVRKDSKENTIFTWKIDDSGKRVSVEREIFGDRDIDNRTLVMLINTSKAPF